MEINILYTKIKRLFTKAWYFIKEAVRPNWMMSSSDDGKEDNGVPIEQVTSNNSFQSTPTDCSEMTENRTLEEMRQHEEIVRLQKMIESLEKSLAERSTVQDVLTQLKSIAGQKKKHKRGRPPKPHVKVLLDLYEEWSLLYELGVLSRQIKWNRTEFVNSAVEYMFKTDYPELYAVYLRSISDASSEFVSLGDEDDTS